MPHLNAASLTDVLRSLNWARRAVRSLDASLATSEDAAPRNPLAATRVVTSFACMKRTYINITKRVVPSSYATPPRNFLFQADLQAVFLIGPNCCEPPSTSAPPAVLWSHEENLHLNLKDSIAQIAGVLARPFVALNIRI